MKYKRNVMICIQLKIKCKITLLKTLENGFNKSYFMTYHCHNVNFRNSQISYTFKHNKKA